MIDKEYARSRLGGEAAELFDDITLSRVLGAGRHAELIGRMLLSIVDDAGEDPADMTERLRAVAGYFKETRGQNSRAVYNAINIMTGDLSLLEGLPAPRIREIIRNQVEKYRKSAAESTSRAAGYAAALCDAMESVMAFDYSGTVDAFLRALGRPMTVYIPESRALDGGRPYVAGALKAGHKVRFIPDAAMLEGLRRCQAAFMGAETLYPDGSVFNTVGSDMLALACREVGVPLYAVSPLIKVDIRPVRGFVRLAPMPCDFKERLAEGWPPEAREAVDFTGVKLVRIPPELIRGIICEAGIIPAGSFYDTAVRYGEALERGAGA